MSENLSANAAAFVAAMGVANLGLIQQMDDVAAAFGLENWTEKMLGSPHNECGNFDYSIWTYRSLLKRCPNPVAMYYNPRGMNMVFVDGNGHKFGTRMTDRRDVAEYRALVRENKGLPPIEDVPTPDITQNAVAALRGAGAQVVSLRRDENGEWKEQ